MIKTKFTLTVYLVKAHHHWGEMWHVKFLYLSLIGKLFFSTRGFATQWGNGILLSKLFWPTVRKKCSIDLEKLLKFKAEGPEFAKILRSLEQFLQTVKGQNNVW